jgi:hypothetical protein
MKFSAFIKQYSVLIYYVLVFIISWGGVLMVIGGLGKIPGTAEEFARMIPLAIPALLAGPFLMGLLLTGLVSGKAGFRDLGSRLLKWRIENRWYVVALLFAPLLFIIILLVLSLFSSRFLPGVFTVDNKISHVVVGLATGIVAGIFEELGWTGFAIPRLRLRYSVLVTGLIAGFLWAIWHLLVTVWASGNSPGQFSVIAYFLDPLLFLPAFRVLMVRVYDRTGSLLIAMLMHMSLTASSRILMPLNMSAGTIFTFDLVWAVVVWIIVVVVFRINKKRISH